MGEPVVSARGWSLTALSLCGQVARSWRLWLGLGVSAVFLLWAFHQVNQPAQILLTLGAADYRLLGPAVGLYFLGVWWRAVRWRLLLAPLGQVPARRLFPLLAIGYMVNDLLPARLGEIARVYALGRQERVSRSAALATIAVERLFDGLTLLGFFGLAWLMAPSAGPVPSLVGWAGLLFVGATVGVFGLALAPGLGHWLAGWLVRVLPARLRERAVAVIALFLEGLRALRSARLLGLVVVTSVLAWLCEALMYYALALGFGLPRTFPPYLLTLAVVNLGTMIPSSPGYIGTFERLGQISLGLFGVDPALALSYLLVLHAALYVPITVVGLYYFWRLNFTFRLLAGQSA